MLVSSEDDRPTFVKFVHKILKLKLSLPYMKSVWKKCTLMDAYKLGIGSVVLEIKKKEKKPVLRAPSTQIFHFGIFFSFFFNCFQKSAIFLPKSKTNLAKNFWK